MKTFTKGNHNSPVPGTQGSPGFDPLKLDTDDIFQMKASFSNMDSDNVTKFFMEAPKDFTTNFLRANIPDTKMRNAIVLAWDRYERWGDERHQKMLINMLIGSRCIGGFASIQAMQVAINILAEQLMLHMTGFKLSKEQRKELEKDINHQMEMKSHGGQSPV